MRKIITLIAIAISITASSQSTHKIGGDTTSIQFAGIGYLDINPFYPDTNHTTQIAAYGFIIHEGRKIRVVDYSEMKRLDSTKALLKRNR